MNEEIGPLDIGIEVRDPRTGRTSRLLVAPTRAELAGLTDQLRAEQPDWAARGTGQRANALRHWAGAIGEHRDELVDALVADTGRLFESRLEVDTVIGTIERWCRLAPDLLDTSVDTSTSFPFVHIRPGLRPYPLVGVISPWNFPLLLGLIDAIPALVAGCAVVVKPSEVTPRFIGPLRRTIRDVPLAVIEGAAETGAALVSTVDAICFTGSVPTGRLVGEAAARAFIPAYLELGGKDPALVLPSADLDRAASAILWGGTANAGQSCLSIERIYVHEDVHDEFVEQLVAKARELRLAWPEPSSGQLGPIIAVDQIAVIERHLADARARGAKVRCGGTIENHDGGSYVPATVLTGVDHTMLVMTEETFGPLLPVMPFRSVEHGIALANDSDYGLSAAVFAGTEDEVVAVARHLDAGAVSINDAALTALVHEGEKNSFKLSGIGGSRMGPASLRRFVRRQSYLVNRGDSPIWRVLGGNP